MKKMIILLLLFPALFLFVACTPNEEAILSSIQKSSIPTGLTVTDNVFSVSSQEGIKTYQLEITSVSDSTTTVYTLESGFDLSYLLSDGDYSVRVRGLLPDYTDTYSDFTDNINFSITSSKCISSIEEDTLTDSNFIRFNGRTNYNTSTKAMDIYYTGSGFVVGFYGTSLTATFTATNTNLVKTWTYLEIFLDGNNNPLTGEDFFLYQPVVTYTLASGLPLGYHTVSVVKKSESLDSNMAIQSLSTDGSFAKPEAAKALKIQFIGASTLTGYGNMESTPNTTKTTENSNGLLAYPALSAYMLDADYSIVAASGWGITRGWNTGGVIDTTKNIPNAFDYLAVDSTNSIVNVPWDQSKFVPNIVVVSLGINDYNTSNYANLTAEERTAFDDRFTTDYVAFLTKLHTYFPDATIILTYGILGVNADMERLTLGVLDIADNTIPNLFACKLTSGAELSLPFGSDYHPGVETHIHAATELVDYIESITTYVQVNPAVELGK